jgi:hypothetical protein
MLTAPASGAESSAEPASEDFTALIERAVGGPELPEYQGAPDSAPLRHPGN